ncbi:extracellular mutant protein 11 domain-containing protein [Trichoderma sp. SZMC 28014]
MKKAAAMPASLKERSSRLQMFARPKSDNDVNTITNIDVTTTAATQQSRELGRYQSSAPGLASVAERRELAESARVPVPNGNARQPAIHQRTYSQPPPESVQQSHSQSPSSRHIDIFTGSQLGDSFMNSGLTTPMYAPSEAEPELKRNTVAVPATTSAPPIIRAPPRYNFDKKFPSSGGLAFQVGEDMRLKVVSVSGTKHHNPSYMNDGFNRGAANGYSRPAPPYRTSYTRPESSPEKKPNMPVREVRLRHVPRTKQIDYDDGQKRSASPAYDSRGRFARDREEDTRPVSRYQGLAEVEVGGRGIEAIDEVEHGDQDDGTSTIGGHEDGRETPRMKRHLLSPQRAVLENAFTTTMPPFRPSVPKDRKRRRESLDYDDMALSNMKYAELQNEAFEFDPSKVTAQVGTGGGADTLNAKLEQYQHQTEKEQHSMFKSMNADDWEEAGDWFADRFGEIMHKLRVARRNKRRMIQDFEQEAASREEDVRLQTETIDQKLSKMKQDGLRVVNAREGSQQAGK